MIKQLLLLFSLLMPGIGFSQVKQDSSFVRINFDATSTIKVNFKNFTDTILLTSSFYNFFPNANIESSPIKLFGEGTVSISLKIQMPQKVDISFAGYFSESLLSDSGMNISRKDLDATCFLIPFDTLEIAVDYARQNPQQKIISFAGKYAPISDYYRNKEIHFNGLNFIYQKAMMANMITNLDTFKYCIDSITNIELEFLNDYITKNDLPQWFVDYESFDLKYFALGLKLDEPKLLEFNRGSTNLHPQVPNGYYAFANDLPLNNDQAILSIYYFLSHNFNAYLIQLPICNKPDTSIKRNMLAEYITYAAAHYSPYISDILLARELEMWISFNYGTDVEYGLLIAGIKNMRLKNYLETRCKNKEILKRGDNAPYFYLKNETNEYLSLNEFTGNVIYLSFWIPGCKPCIKEFPNENNLVDVFKNEKVKIISICMDSKEDVWKQLIKNYQLKTVNLFSNENWKNSLKKNYDISGFPHYVLIDKGGKIVENKCIRPSDGAEQEIRNCLSK